MSVSQLDFSLFPCVGITLGIPKIYHLCSFTSQEEFVGLYCFVAYIKKRVHIFYGSL